MRRLPRFRPALLCLEQRDVPAVLTVTSPADSGAGSLRQAVLDAAAGDTIQFDGSLAGGTVALTGGTLTLNKNLTIDGPGAAQLTLAGTSAARVLTITTGTAVSLSGLTIADGDGGIQCFGSLTMTDCVVAHNAVTGPGLHYGGGIDSSGPLTMTDCTVWDNRIAGGYGGGIRCFAAMTLTDCAIVANSNLATGSGVAFGGGIYSLSAFPLTMTGCTVGYNTAAGIGPSGNGYAGGLYINGGMATLTNCTIAGNDATGAGDTRGGGIFALGTFSLTLTNCTVTGNEAASASFGSAGGIGGTSGWAARLLNTIVAGNYASATAPDVSDSSGTVASLGHNLIGIADGSHGWVASDLTGTADSPLDARLSFLNDNGGPTWTVALWADSPAIAAGDPVGTPATDQRGTTRGTPPSIGAVEYVAAVTDHFQVDLPDRAYLGDPFSITVTARDQYGNTVVTYAGTVHLATTDAQATVPADYAFTPADYGTHTFDGAVHVNRGTQTWTATDTADALLMGSAALTAGDPQFRALQIGPGSVTAGVPFTVTFQVMNDFGDIFLGTAHIETTQPDADLPPDSTFTVEDAGLHPFAVTLFHPGQVGIIVSSTYQGVTYTVSRIITVFAP